MHCDSQPKPALPLLGIQTEDVPGIAFAFFLGKDSCLSRSTPRSRSDLAVSRRSRLHTLESCHQPSVVHTLCPRQAHGDFTALPSSLGSGGGTPQGRNSVNPYKVNKPRHLADVVPSCPESSSVVPHLSFLIRRPPCVRRFEPF
jgi:hypothetical protein